MPGQGSLVTSDGEGGSTYTNPTTTTTTTTPGPRYPRNRVAQWSPTAHATDDRRVASQPISDGPPGPRRPNPDRYSPPSNPWTDPGPGRQWGTRGSADPAASMPYSWTHGGATPGGGNQPVTPMPNEMKVSPAGYPGATKYDVQYDPWGRKIRESYDAGKSPAGQYKAQPGMNYNFGPNGPPPGFYEGNGDGSWANDPRNKLWQEARRRGGNNFAQFDGGMPYSIPYGARINIQDNMQDRYYGNKRGTLNSIDTMMPMEGYRPGDNGYSGNVDSGLSPWDSPRYKFSGGNNFTDYDQGDFGMSGSLIGNGGYGGYGGGGGK